MINRLSKLAIAILFYAGYAVFRMICRLTGRRLPPALIILTYHPVKAVHTRLFENQMEMLLKAGNPVSLGGGTDMLKSGYNIAVTFDDAYQSVLQNALPVLHEKNIPATIFVPTGCLGEKPMWIKNKNHCYADETVVTEDQLSALPADLISIGSHTVSHINLTNVDENIARKEIFESKETLEKILGQKVTLFAAPYATLDEKFTGFFRQAGYERVFLNIPTLPATRTDLYILGRTSVEPTDWPLEYRLKISGAYQWLPLAIRLKKTLLG